jgi:hypothetical protein
MDNLFVKEWVVEYVGMDQMPCSYEFRGTEASLATELEFVIERGAQCVNAFDEFGRYVFCDGVFINPC